MKQNNKNLKNKSSYCRHYCVWGKICEAKQQKYNSFNTILGLKTFLLLKTRTEKIDPDIGFNLFLDFTYEFHKY